MGSRDDHGVLMRNRHRVVPTEIALFVFVVARLEAVADLDALVAGLSFSFVSPVILAKTTMDATKPLPPPPEESTDIFSISDQVLADSLQFVEEVRLPVAQPQS